MHKVLIILLLGLFLAGTLHAEEDRTYLKSKKGMVRIKKAGGSWAKASVGMDLGIGDMVKTLSNGAAEVVLADSGVIKVKPGTEFYIPEDKANTGKKTGFVKLVKGFLWAKAKKDKNSLKIATPNAICGVRGTEFMIEVGRDHMRLMVTDGAVAFVPLIKGVVPRAQLVRPGQQVFFRPSVAKKKAEQQAKQNEEAPEEEVPADEEVPEDEEAPADEEVPADEETPVDEAADAVEEALGDIEVEGDLDDIDSEVFDEVMDVMEDPDGDMIGFDDEDFMDGDMDIPDSEYEANELLDEEGMALMDVDDEDMEFIEEFTDNFMDDGGYLDDTEGEVLDYVDELIDNTAADLQDEGEFSNAIEIDPGEYGQVKVTW